MENQIFINLPVKDLEASMTFFKALGMEFNMDFTDDTAACLVVSEFIYVMLVTRERFSKFTPKEVADATKTSEVMLALSVSSRERVDEVYQLAIEAGATEERPSEDAGSMYGRSFNDLDGHIWEIFWMDREP